MRLILIALILTGLLLAADQPRNRALGSSSVRHGATLPSTCRPSPDADVFYKSGANLGLYVCTALNTWSLSVPGATLDAVTGAAALTEVNTIPRISAAGVLGLSKLKCPLGVCTLYDDTATTGVTTLVVRAGAGQGSANLAEWKNAAGANLIYVYYHGGISAGGYEISNQAYFSSDSLQLAAGARVQWPATAGYWGARDLALYRLNPGTMAVRGATATDWGSLSANNLTAVALATPAVPVITQGGTGGATPYGYKIACLGGDATTTAASTEGTTATGNATLSATDYNIVTFTPSTGMTTCDVFRITGGATQGKIGNTATSPFNDTGLAASGAAPTANTTGSVTVGIGGLLFGTDNTTDIGYLATSRPRDGFFARHVEIGGNAYVTGYVNLGATSGIYWGALTNVYPLILRDGTGIKIRAASDDADAKLSAAPGGTVPAWKLLQLAGVANGVGDCTNATGCWSVNGGTAIAQTAGLTQDVVLEALPAKAQVSDWRIKTNTICTGATTAKVGLGTTASNVLFRAQIYDIGAAVSGTNLTTGPTAGAGSNTAAATNLVASLITTVENVDAIVDTCKVDIWVLYGVLP